MNRLNQLIDTPKFQQFMTDIAGKCSNAEYAKNIGAFIVQGWKNGLITEQNWDNIIDKINSIDSFSDLPAQNRGVFGATFHDNTERNGLHVMINPDLDEFHRRQYSFHELAHVVLDGESEKIKNIIKEQSGLDENNPGDKNIIENMANGYTVIEESIAQEVSEKLVYSSYGIDRPEPSIQRDNTLPNTQFRSNWHFYGLYHPLGIAFAKTFRGIGCLPQMSNRNDKAMELLCQKAFEGDFANQICEEYDRDGVFLNLCQAFKKLGKVYGVKQASFGVGDIPWTQENINLSEQSYNEVFNELTELEDRRPITNIHRHDIDMDMNR